MAAPLLILSGALLAALLLASLAVFVYNLLVRSRILVREAFSGIDVQLKRRHDLIPNLVATVEGYAAHEKDILERVTRLRTQAMGDVALAEREQDENLLSNALRGLLAVAENYPQLQANESFLDLQRQLVAIEDDLQKARRYYNGTVREYNTRVESFPSNLVAGLFAFQQAEFFEIESAAAADVPPLGVQPPSSHDSPAQ